jgi:hypothetical protein
MSITSYYYLSGYNITSALTEEAAFVHEHIEKDTTHFSYYGSIFSNLSRGLPIDGSSSSSEPPTGEEENDQVNANSTISEQQ